MFGQGSRADFGMGSHGDELTMHGFSCGAMPVTVERTCIRLLVMEILSVEVENSIRLFPYETYRIQ